MKPPSLLSTAKMANTAGAITTKAHKDNNSSEQDAKTIRRTNPQNRNGTLSPLRLRRNNSLPSGTTRNRQLSLPKSGKMLCVSDQTTDHIQPPKAGNSLCCKSNGNWTTLSKHGMSNTLPKSPRKPQRKPLPKIRQTICSATKPKSSKPKPLPSAPSSKPATSSSVLLPLPRL